MRFAEIGGPGNAATASCQGPFNNIANGSQRTGDNQALSRLISASHCSGITTLHYLPLLFQPEQPKRRGSRYRYFGNKLLRKLEATA